MYSPWSVKCVAKTVLKFVKDIYAHRAKTTFFKI